MSRQFRVLCGTPEIHCSGGKLVTDQQTNSRKCHSSHEDAFRCHVRYLVNILGFTRIGPREFQNPDGGPVRVITKKSRFGGILITGKGVKGMPSRFMPDKRNTGNRGVIV